MLVDTPVKTHMNDFVRISSTLTWEDCDRKPLELFYDVPNDCESLVHEHPNSFLIMAAIGAAHKERRVKTADPVCPVLLQGLKHADATFLRWQRNRSSVLSLDCPCESESKNYQNNRQAAMFLSGGVDSLCSLYLNLKNIPRNHPAAVKLCWFIYGFDMGMPGVKLDHRNEFNSYFKKLSGLLEKYDIKLIPVYTNARAISPSSDFWIYTLHGAALASVAHGFSPCVQMAYLASTNDVSNLIPWGSHPLIDVEYSSYDMRIKHVDHNLTRLEKVRCLAQWPEALDICRVCTRNPPGRLNCETCEKCHRTMMEFETVGALKTAGCFENNKLKLGDLLSCGISSDYQVACLWDTAGYYWKNGKQIFCLVMLFKFLFFKLRNIAYALNPIPWIKRTDQRFWGGKLLFLKRKLVGPRDLN